MSLGVPTDMNMFRQIADPILGNKVGVFNSLPENLGRSAFRPFRTGLTLFAAGALLSTMPAAASTQGSVGATSTGSVAITVSVPNRVQITGLTDIDFSNSDPMVQATNSQSNCVWSNTATKGYTITASGSGTAGAFTLASASLTPVIYTVLWNQSPAQTTGTSLTAATASSGFVSTATRPGCIAAPLTSSSLTVQIATSELQHMASLTNYTGTLTLLVNPQ